MNRIPQLIILFAALLCFMTTEIFAETSGKGVRIFSEVKAKDGDEVAELYWNYVDGALESGAFAGVRVYRLLNGDQINFRVEPLRMIEDVGTKTKLKVSGLTNGSRVIFYVLAYDKEGKDIEHVALYCFPGSKAKDTPPAVKNLYVASGAQAISVFWDPLEQVNIDGYEVLRRAKDEHEFVLLGRMKKVVGIDVAKSGMGQHVVLPEIQPTMFRDTSVLPGIDYVYQVRAVDTAGKVGPGVDSAPVGWQAARSPLPGEVLLLARWDSSDSKKVARYYAERRGVPKDNILVVSPHKGNKYRNRQILEEVREHLLDEGLAGKIRVIVPCYGLPLGDGGRSLDSMLMDLFGRYTWGRVMGTPSPVYGKELQHDPSLGVYLVSRLDGPTPEIAMGLVDKAIEAEKKVSRLSGRAFFNKGDFGHDGVKAAERNNVPVLFESMLYTKENLIPDDIIWYFGTGHAYRKIRKTPWPVGAVAGFLKSDTLAQIHDPRPRYWVQGFLEEGVTATYGAVAEPYVQGYTRGDILLDRFWTGKYNFAESYAMATPTLRWVMCAIGDPLYKLNHASWVEHD